MRRLPPLTAVEAFVQVARLGSVKAAAEALALSSPALSRRVQALERFIGRRLFDRRHQAMMLNADGQQLLARISPALDALTVAIDATRGDTELLRLRLSVPPLFATQRLIPSLPELRAQQPSLHIDIDTASQKLARLGEGIDAAIVLAREIDQIYYSRRIVRSQLAVIGSTNLLSGPEAFKTPADIARMTIFLHRDMPDLFNNWRDAMGLPDLEPAAIDQFDSGPVMFEAAAQGLGLAFLLEEHIEQAQDDRVANFFADEIDSGYSYWFASRRTALSAKAVRIFHDWLFSVFV